MTRFKTLAVAFLIVFALLLSVSPAQARDPRFSVYAGYSATRVKPVLKDATAAQGFNVQASVRLVNRFSLKADYTNLNAPGNARILTFGPEIRTGKHVQLFGHAMLGFVKSTNTVGSTGTIGRIKVKDADVAAIVGGGLDIKPASWLGFRLAQVDYLRAPVAATGAKNQFRVGAGVVISF